MVERPVVTLQGDDVAQVRDVVFNESEGSVAGFTLAKRSRFGGPIHDVALPWETVRALGPDAVMIRDADALRPEPIVPASDEAPGSGDVLGDRVVTEGGVELGTVVDAVVELADESAAVVGYEMEPADGFEPRHGRKGRRLFIPRPDTITASDNAVIVPDAAVDYVAEDLAGFGEAVESFRAHLRDAST
jgi:sporulation protein YlmC with PRC-barrel domain